MADKDAILDSILRLESQMAEWKEEHDSAVLKVEETKPQYEAVTKEYEAVKARFQETEDALRQSQYTAKIALRNAVKGREELDKLKRELGRIVDSELINKQLKEKYDALANALPDAVWRVGNANGDRAMLHQVEGAIHMAVAEQSINGDDRGLGKTLTSLIYCDLVGARKVIAIVPSDVQGNFAREVKLWSNRPVVKLGGNTKDGREFLFAGLKRMDDFFVLLNYEAWRKDKSLIDDLIALKADTLILDEAHHAKTIETSICRGIMRLRFGANKCDFCGNPRVTVGKNDAHCACGAMGHPIEFSTFKHIVPMTGTPILNKPQELYPLCRLVDPVNFPSANSFLYDFCRKVGNRWTWQYGGEKRLIERIGPRFIKRTRHDAGVVLPPMKTITHTIPWSVIEQDYPAQHKAYLQARDYAELMLDPDNDIVMSMPVFLTVLLRLRQVITAPSGVELKVTEYDDDGNKIGVNVVARLDVDESAKLDKAEELIREIVEEGDRVVVFSKLTEPLLKLHARLGPKSVTYRGGMTDAAKREIELDFDAKSVPVDPKFKVALVNYASGGEGLNFTGANHTIILDREWNPGREGQAAGRMDRIGQTKDTFLHVIEVENTVDMWMAKLIQEKTNLIAGFEGEVDVFRKAYDALKSGMM